MSKSRGKRLMTAGFSMMIVGGGLLLLASIFSAPEDPAPLSPFRIVSSVEVSADSTLFFWYGCPHCLKVEELIMALDVSSTKGDEQPGSLAYVPAVFDPIWELHARLYYALETLGYSRIGHFKMMEAIQSNFPRTEDDVARLLASGLLSTESKSNDLFVASVDEVMSQMLTNSVDDKINSSRALSMKIGLKGVPTLLVGDHQVLELGSSVGYEDMAKQALKSGEED